jgi:transposase
MFAELAAAVRVYLCTRPTDMRKGFDGLQGISGHLFLFLNRHRDRIKLLWWDRDGLVIWYKRLEAGTFQQPDPSPGSG